MISASRASISPLLSELATFSTARVFEKRTSGPAVRSRTRKARLVDPVPRRRLTSQRPASTSPATASSGSFSGWAGRAGSAGAGSVRSASTTSSISRKSSTESRRWSTW
ncbi:hypothetical protein SANTM175S_08908 [Streptomyces antimycoticus]